MSTSSSPSSGSSLTLEEHLNRKTFVMGLQLWTVIGIAVGISIFAVLLVLAACLSLRHHRHRHRHRSTSTHRWGSGLPLTQIPAISKEIKEVTSNYLFEPSIEDITEPNESETAKIDLGTGRSDSYRYMTPDDARNSISPLVGLPEFSYLGWGHWFTLRDLELATNRFAKENIIGEGGYGIVYRGQLVNGAPVAVKKLLNNL